MEVVKRAVEVPAERFERIGLGYIEIVAQPVKARTDDRKGLLRRE